MSTVLVGAVVSAIGAVYLSSAHMAQFAHGTVVLPWAFPFPALAAFGLAGLFLALLVVLRPGWYWSTLVFVSAASAGMSVLRFSLFDEWLALSIALGGAWACAHGGAPKRARVENIMWVYAFLGLGAYYALESLVGYSLYSNVKALRYTVIAGAVLLIGWTVSRYEVKRPSPREVTMLLASAGFFYYTLVILHGLTFPSYAFVLVLEGIGNAGSSDLCVVGILAMPASVILIGTERGWRRWFGVLVLAFGTVIAALGDARGGIIAVAGALLAAPFAMGIGRSIVLWSGATGGLVLLGMLAFDRPQWPLDMAGALLGAVDIQSGTIQTVYHGELVAHARGDAGRAYYVRGAVRALMEEGPRVALIGAGTYGYFPVAGPHYEVDAREGGVATVSINVGAALSGAQAEPPRPPALGAIIAETGLVGMALLGALLAFSLRSTIMRRTRPGAVAAAMGANVLVAMSLLLAVAWTYFGDAPGTIFFYLLVMPYGIAHTWSRVDARLTHTPSRAVGTHRRTPRWNGDDRPLGVARG